MIHAGNYSGTLHFLKAVADMGVPAAKKSGTAIAERMKAMPVDDDCFQGKIRAGRARPVARLPVRGEEAVREQGQVGLLEAGRRPPRPTEAWRPLADGHCSYVKPDPLSLPALSLR